MKISDNLFMCPWCEEKIKHIPKSSSAEMNINKQVPGRHKVTSALRCPKCGRVVSQK